METLVITIIDRIVGIASLVILFLIVREQFKTIEYLTTILSDIIGRLAVAYGEELQTQRLRKELENASKYRNTRED